MKFAFLIVLLSLFSSYSFGISGDKPFGNFDETSLLKFKRLLQKASNTPFHENDFVEYHERIELFKSKKRVKFSQKDVVIHTFAYLDRGLFDRVLGEGADETSDIQIELYRQSPQIIQQVAVHPMVPPVVRAAAKLSIYGTENTPAIISDLFVNHVAGISSAYSTLDAEMAFVYEGFRKSTYHDLIIGHEGFHSAMRLLSTFNRMNRLAKIIPTPLANGADYDAYLEQDISDLEMMAAPNLEELHIDERFTSDHHGVIMATLHHGALEAIKSFFVDYPGIELYETKYPFHYIEKEKNWDPALTQEMVGRLQEKHDQFLMESDVLNRSLIEVSKKIHNFENVFYTPKS